MWGFYFDFTMFYQQKVEPPLLNNPILAEETFLVFGFYVILPCFITSDIFSGYGSNVNLKTNGFFPGGYPYPAWPSLVKSHNAKSARLDSGQCLADVLTSKCWWLTCPTMFVFSAKPSYLSIDFTTLVDVMCKHPSADGWNETDTHFFSGKSTMVWAFFMTNRGPMRS